MNHAELIKLDKNLALVADVLDDLERVRIANENRLRQMTRAVEDKDGNVRGLGMTEAHPDVARLAELVDALAKAEKDAVKNLQHVVRRHPLYPWAKAQRGVGEKQAARLLATIGDPYLRPEMEMEDGTVQPARPRMVSELLQYAGHGDPDRSKRRKGQQAEYSPKAKMRVHNIVESMLKAGNRDVYDKRKNATEGREHHSPCVRCGPSGKPALPGTPWNPGHRHADALRVMGKELLKSLWRAGKEIHEQDR